MGKITPLGFSRQIILRIVVEKIKLFPCWEAITIYFSLHAT